MPLRRAPTKNSPLAGTGHRFFNSEGNANMIPCKYRLEYLIKLKFDGVMLSVSQQTELEILLRFRADA